MNIAIREYIDEDIHDMIAIWNEVVEEGIAFPQEDILNLQSGNDFLRYRSCNEPWSRRLDS